MKERPILFSAPMVRAILEGRKTQTRRIVKFDIPSWANHVRNLSGAPWNIFQWVEVDKTHHPGGICVKWWPDENEGRSCPYGQPDDRLWVKETYCRVHDSDFGGANWIDYRATPRYAASHPAGWDNAPDDPQALKWKPSIFMPRWASRILLEIVSVRVERLQDISEDDAEAEGIESIALPTGGDDYQDYWKNYGVSEKQADGWPWFTGDQLASYRSLWESIHGAGSWETNPYVWVIEFRRTEQ